jgi:hypothetical protein
VTDNNELHVVFGSGPVGMTVMDELASRGKRVRMVNRGGRANVPEGVEVVGGDATDPAFTREVSVEASTSYNALNPPYNKWPKLFPPLQASVLEGAAAAGAKLGTVENLYMYGPTGGQPLTEDLPHAANTRKGAVRARMTEELFAAHESGKVRARIRSAHGLRHHRCSPSASLVSFVRVGRRYQALARGALFRLRYRPASPTGESLSLFTADVAAEDGGMLRLKRKRLVGSWRSLSATRRSQSSGE